MPLKIGEIESIAIAEQAATAPAAAGQDVDCSGFVLTQVEVTHFFENADEVSESDYRHMLDWSPCYVAGTLRLTNGTTGEWGVHQLRGGSLYLSNGTTHYLYCPACEATAFPDAQ